MSRQEVADAELVDAWLASGDRRGLDRLLRRYQAYILRLCCLMAPSAEDASEWSQEAMLTLARQLRRFDPRRPFKPWLRQVVLNVCRNQRRVTRQRLSRERPLGEQAAADPQGPAPGAGLAPPDPEEQVLQRESLRTLRQAWERLPDEWRTALWLRAVEGLSYQEIAAAGSWPGGTVKTYIFRAREALRAALFDAGAGREEGGRSR
ncbi:MAG: RNA polymerase sigma factor [Bacillota bacterium]